MPDRVVLTPIDDGAFVELRLSSPPRNILDGAMLEAIAAAARVARRLDHARAMLLCADGPSFSAGASVGEHGRTEVSRMLSRFSDALIALLDADLPIVAAIRGHCLGGGLELALCAMRIHAAADARFGQPEIRLGAFAPVASLMLPRRIGQARAEELLLSGVTIDAPAAREIGLITAIDADPEAAARGWIRDTLSPLSASSLRIATRAARAAMRAELDLGLRAMSRHYLDHLSPTHDAEEGVQAFLDKRAPRWEHR
jgi:cyclohexa-1,5-dienecarbonyl-CoA hydratase